MDQLIDRFGRTVGDVRISVTDRCNFRCTYCMPADYSDWLPKSRILSYEEMARLVRILKGFGIHTVRLTGGEPLARRDLPELVRMLHTEGEGEIDLSLTTNAFFLPDQAQALADAGLSRVNVSLDSLRPERFAEMTRRDALPRVLEGIAAASAAGLNPLKVNVVMMRGVNDDEVLDLIDWGRDGGYQVRFIEFMPLDGGHTWTKEKVYSKAEILKTIAEVHPFKPEGIDEREPAQRYVFEDGKGEFGVIGSVTEPFCSKCDRIRITADGMLRTCLFAIDEMDLRTPIREGASDEDLANLFRAAVTEKGPGHRIGRKGFVQPDRPMVAIGG